MIVLVSVYFLLKFFNLWFCFISQNVVRFHSSEEIVIFYLFPFWNGLLGFAFKVIKYKAPFTRPASAAQW
jgi:hypothetical protein